MEQPKKLLVGILVSSLVSNVILIAFTAASVNTFIKIKTQVEETHQRIERVQSIVEEIKALRGTVKERVRERRAGVAADDETDAAGSSSRPRPLQRLRNR